MRSILYVAFALFDENRQGSAGGFNNHCLLDVAEALRGSTGICNLMLCS